MSQFDPAEFGRAMGALVRDAVAPLLKRIEALEGRDTVKELLATDKLETLVSLEVAAYLEANPPAQGEKGETGEKGRDGLDVKDLFRADGGKLVAVMSDGTTKDLGVFVGQDGKPGKDGADFSDASIDYDGERTITVKGRGTEIVKRVPIPLDRGYWSAGQFEKGDVVTHNGVAFIAQRDTSAEPKTENSADWRILARKGRDGKDGRNGIDKTAPVKVSRDA